MSETSIFNGDPGAAARSLIQHALTRRDLCGGAGLTLEDRMLDELCALRRGDHRRRRRQDPRRAALATVVLADRAGREWLGDLDAIEAGACFGFPPIS